MKRTELLLTAVLALGLLLGACGGGGGGGGGSDGDGDGTSKAWGTAALIETDNAGNAEYAQVAFSANGTAIAVWQQFDGTRKNIMSNRYTAGSGWGTAALIETDDAGNATNPQVVIDASGNALAVWEQHDGTRSNIMSNRYTAGSGWGAAELIETDNAGGAYVPQIAMDANGNAIAVWAHLDGARSNIMSNRYTVGSGWGTAELIEADDVGTTSRPQVAVTPNGNAIAVWDSYIVADLRSDVWATRYTAGSGWGTAALIETDNAGDAAYPQVAVDASGNALAVWEQFDGTRKNIMSNRYTAGSGWGTAALVETDNAGNAYYPQIAIDASGNALAVWEQYDGTRYNIMSNRYVVGSGWGAAALVETNNAGDASSAQVAVGANGNAIAVWHQFDGTRSNIWSNRFE